MERRSVAIALVVSVSLAVVAVTAHRLARRDLPRPLYAEADLPPAPAARENGFAYLAAHAGAVDLDSPAEVMRDVRLIGSPDERWLHAVGHEGEIRALLAQDDVARALTIYEQALSMPHFVDLPIPIPDDESVGPYRPLSRVDGLLRLRALDALVRGDVPRALEDASRSLEAASALRASARSIPGERIASGFLLLHVSLAETFERGIREQAGTTNDDAVRDWIAHMDAALARPYSSRSAVIGEYPFRRALILSAFAETRARMRAENPGWRGILLSTLDDPVDTLERYDAYYARLVRYAGDPVRRRAPTIGTGLDRPIGYIWNPIGRMCLETLPRDMELAIMRCEGELASERERWASVRRVLIEWLARR